MKLKKCLSMILSFIIAITASLSFYGSYQNIDNFTAVATDDTEQTYDTWQEAYRDKLIEFRNSDKYNDDNYPMFELYDINNDNIPELFISTGFSYASGSCQVYSYVDSKCKLLKDTGSNYGETNIIPSQGILCDGSGHMGRLYYNYYSFDGNELNLLDSLYCQIYNQPYEYYHNEQSVSEKEFNKIKSYYDNMENISVGRKNKFDELYYKYGDIYYAYYFDYYEAYLAETSSTTLSIANTVNNLPVKSIQKYLLIENNSVQTLNIPANILNFYYFGLNGSSLTTINVDSANPYYTSKDGVIYNKDMTTLIKFPTAKDASTFTFPQSVTEIGRYSFAWCTDTRTIVIPETVNIINEYAFFICDKLSSITIKNSKCDIYDYWNSDNGITICNTYDLETEKGSYLGVIRGYDDSYAQMYAENFGVILTSIANNTQKRYNIIG